MPSIIKVRSNRYRADYSVQRKRHIKGIHIPLPNYQQEDSHSCSYIATLTVCRYLGVKATDEDILSVVRCTQNGGADGEQVQAALKQLGITHNYRDDLIVGDLWYHVHKMIPVMLTVWPWDWSGDHWVVVQGFSDNRIHLTNHYSMTLDEFWDEWVSNWEDGAKHGCGIACIL